MKKNLEKNLSQSGSFSLVFSLLILSLFVPIRFHVPPFFLIRPFDLLTVLIFLYWIVATIHEKEKIAYGYFYLYPFFIFHVLSALTVSGLNFTRELLQVVILLMFAFLLSKFKEKIDYEKAINYLFVGFISIMAYTIFWHVVIKGYAVGWKRLPDPRLIYTLITLLAFAYINIFQKKEKSKFPILILIILLLPILVMSGERKALIVYFFLLLIHLSRGFTGFTLRAFFLVIILYIIANLLTSYIENPYMKHKIDSALNIMHTGNVDYVIETGTLEAKDAYSSVQRVFALEQSKELFLKNPFFGVGTNNYLNIVEDRYYYLPKWMYVGIHGEFQRTLVENGLIGFLLYIFIWYASWTRTKKILHIAKKDRIVNDEQIRFCLYGLYFTLALYVGTEASSTRSFILLIFISILPDYLTLHLKLSSKIFDKPNYTKDLIEKSNFK